jgi:FAD/FMN-containing dehydrogenase
MVLNLNTLQQRVTGKVITPDHPDYHTARKAWNLTTDQYPALILIPETVDDVIAGVNYAHETGLGIAVQSTGHGIQIEANDALLILTEHLNAVSVDPTTRTAQVGAGVRWGAVVEASAPYGLAPLLGSAPHVGVVGYSLGGGIGWLARKYGLAADSVRWIEIVTPDGILRRASETENRELFWGLRGGGGNFGVVTALAFDLYPVAILFGGNLTYPGELVSETLHFYRDWVKPLPDEMTSSLQVVKLPDLPFIPEALRGQTQVILRAAYAGNPDDGAKLIQAWLDWHTPIQNQFKELPFTDIGTVSNDPVAPSAGYGSSETLDELSDEVIELITRQMTDSSSPLMVTELRHGGGAIARIPGDANAIGNRTATFFMQMAGLAPTPDRYEAVKQGIHDYKNALRSYVRGGVYLNFMKGEESAARIEDAYTPEAYQRLLALKRQVDPDNRFRFSYQLVRRAS